jgi:hypothetical protein
MIIAAVIRLFIAFYLIATIVITADRTFDSVNVLELNAGSLTEDSGSSSRPPEYPHFREALQKRLEAAKPAAGFVVAACDDSLPFAAVGQVRSAPRLVPRSANLRSPPFLQPNHLIQHSAV